MAAIAKPTKNTAERSRRANHIETVNPASAEEERALLDKVNGIGKQPTEHAKAAFESRKRNQANSTFNS